MYEIHKNLNLTEITNHMVIDTLKLYALTETYLPIFSLPIAFIYMVHQNFPHQIFSMYGIRNVL